jgi:hypothetical protein
LIAGYSRAELDSARRNEGEVMEQVPHWLMVTVFAAGMTAYAEEVEPNLGEPRPLPGTEPSTPSDLPDLYH